MPYPAAPWQMHGQLWLSLFRVRAGDHPDRRPGVYGAALVSYEAPSPLTYSELLLARPVKAPGARGAGIPGSGKASRVGIEITDIWVDSADSRDGGRELWAIPKGLCDFDRSMTGDRLQRATWNTSLEGTPIAQARFSDVSSLALRMPLRGATRQHRRAPDPRAGQEVVTPLSGSAKVLPCRGSWEFSELGPLAWLAGKRAIASFRMTDFAISFG